jgi:hypothetical protein
MEAAFMTGSKHTISRRQSGQSLQKTINPDFRSAIPPCVIRAGVSFASKFAAKFPYVFNHRFRGLTQILENAFGCGN